VTVVHYEQPAPLPDSRPGDEHDEGPRGWVARLRAAAEIANYVGATDFVPQQLRGNPAAIAAAILYGEEVGLEPMQALAKIAVIKGRPTLSAEAQRGLVASAGHELWFEESTTTRAIAAGRRAGTDRVGRVTWTLDDAKRAGIAGGENWRRYPAEMLRARASAALCRAMFADVLGGLPAAEELEGEPENGVVDAVTPEPPADVEPAKPRPAAETRPPVAPTPPPDEQPQPEMPPEPPASDAQKRQIFALMRDAGMPDDREWRLAYTASVIGHEIASSKELTLAEAGRLIEQLQADTQGGDEAGVLAALKEAGARELPTFEPPAQVREQLDAEADDANDDVPEVDANGDPVPYSEFPARY
jgi:hypothetical protein